MELTQELVKELFDYRDGFLYWKVRPANRVQIGDRAASLSRRKKGNKYVVIIKCKNYLCSRIIFLWHHGYLPLMVDHENRITTDDRIENIREATRSQNMYNKTSAKNSTSKYLGVYRNRNKWKVQIRGNGQKINIGAFDNEEQAALAYNREAVRYHKEFANLNIIQVTRMSTSVG